jgi:hypothetical protein
MSLGSIPRQKHSDAQFVGDLMGLFRRHRIESAEDDGCAQFERNLASKDAFRSQLFTLCTAISHMADEDLSGEELLALIGRALGVREEDCAKAIPESMRSAFLAGYDGWSNRSMSDSDIWPPERKPIPAHEPIPFPQPTEALPEPEYGLRVPGLPTVQEALLMAQKQAPFELPVRVMPLRGAQAGAASPQPSGSGGPSLGRVPSLAQGTTVENLTVSELTRLLEEIEQRMSRMRPQIIGLTSLIQPAPERLDGDARGDDGTGAHAAQAKIMAAKVAPQPATPQVGEVRAELAAELLTPEDVDNDPFVARHAYLNPKRRRHPLATPPAPLLEAASTPAAALPAFVGEAEWAHAAARELVPPTPDANIIPGALNSLVAQYQNIDAAIAVQPNSYGILVHIAIGVLAAVILVSIPLAAVMVYRSSHTRYVYHDLKRPVESGAGATAISPDGSSGTGQPAATSNDGTSKAPAGAAAGKAGPGSRRSAKRKPPPPPMAVWPPPPPN